jgi:hypothetical protein
MFDRTLSLLVFLGLLFLALMPVGVRARRVKPATLRPAVVQAATVIINEYLADPPDGPSGDANGDGTRNSTQDEFVELVNTGSSPLDIGGFKVSDATSASPLFTFPPGKIIPAGEAAVLFGGGTPTGAFGNATANGLVFAIGGSGLSLNNSGDSIIVTDSVGVVVASVSFGSPEGNANQSITRSPDIIGGFVFHSSASGSGGSAFSPGTRVDGFPFGNPVPVITSLSPASVLAGSGPVTLTVNGGNFQGGAQVRVNGAPLSTVFVSSIQLTAPLPASVINTPAVYVITVQNPDSSLSNPASLTVSAPIVLSVIGVNEFLADPPDGAAGDANGDGTRDSAADEFVEIVNRTQSPIDVGGFTVSDSSEVRFTFPPATSIPSTEVAVIFGGGSPRGDFGNATASGLVFTATLSLNNGGDAITIRDGSGNVVESVVFGGSEGGANQSVNRNPDIVGTGFVFHSSIQDSGGRRFSPGTRTDGSTFTVAPRINAVFPDAAPLGSPPLPIVVRGSGFETGSIVVVDSSPLDTARLSEDELNAVVPSSVLGVAGSHLVRVLTQGGARSNAIVFNVIPPPPLLRSLLPRVALAGSAGATLFLQGAGFDSSAAVMIDGSAVQTTIVNPRELIASVPRELLINLGSRRVRVRNGDGQSSNDLSLEVIPPGPGITALLPAQTIAGGLEFSLAVLGSNFTARSVVVFDRTHLPTTFIGPTQLQAVVAARLIAEVGLHSVMVETDGATSNEVPFRAVPIAPLIESLKPAAVVEGGGEAHISVFGERFQRGAVVRVVEHEQPGLRLDTSFVGPERLEARLPAVFTERATRLALRVDNPDLGISREVRFDVLVRDPLVINEYLADPPDGDSGDANGDGSRSSSQDEFVEIVNRTSEPIDISGWRLSDEEEVRHVFAAGAIVPPFETVLVFGGGRPTGSFGNAADNGLVIVASSGGLSLNNGGDVIRLENSSGKVVQEIRVGVAEGNANQSLNREPDVDGPGFSRHTLLDSRGRLFSPGTKATGEAFTVKPDIGRLTPTSVRLGSTAFSLVVSGGDFMPGAEVLFGDSVLETTYRTGGEVEALVSSDLITDGGVVEVRVRNPRGELSNGSRFVIIDEPPRLSSFTPRKTSTGAEGLELTVSGDRFQRGAKILVNGDPIEAAITSGAERNLVALLPARHFSQAGLLELRVMNADGNASNPVSLPVENGPLITRLSRNRLKAGRGAVELTVYGVAFKVGSVLFVGDKPMLTTLLGDTSLRAVVAEELTSFPGNLLLQIRSADGGRSNRVSVRVMPDEQ